MPCLNWNHFSAKGCFTVPFTALLPGRDVSKSHIYIPLHCVWAQSSKEMHNAGRLMTWNVSHESILINWSRKDLPWKESPQKLASSLFIPRASPGARAVSGQRRLLSDGGRKAPTCMTALRPVSTIQFSAYHLSLLFAFSLLFFFFFLSHLNPILNYPFLSKNCSNNSPKLTQKCVAAMKNWPSSL